MGSSEYACVSPGNTLRYLLATIISTSAVSVPIKLLALQVQFPVSSGSADSRIKLLPMTALPLFFFTQIISGFGVPKAIH